MDSIKKALRMPYVPAALLVSGAWFAGSAYWYTCQTQELCEDTEQTTTSQVTGNDTEQAPVIASSDAKANNDVVIIDNTSEQPVTVEDTPETEAEVTVEPEPTPEPAVAAAVDDSADDTPADPDSPFDTSQTVTAFYAPNQASFARTGWEGTMRSFASHLMDNPSASVEIAGYAANVSNEIDEQSLSQSRAQALADYLIAEGVSTDQIDVVVKAYEEPIGDNTTEEGRSKNRRAVARFK